MTLAAVLFDMDGTLIDTEKLWDVALRELATLYGGELSDAARMAMLGSDAANTMRLMSEDLGRPDIDAEAGAAWLDARVNELFAAGVPWRPGARELVAAVRAAGVPTALVTNTSRVVVDVALRTLGVDNFDVVICGDEVAFTKPHPEHYRAAAAALGVDPARCVAIEDSPNGIVSALAAGCVVLGVPSEVALDEQPGVTLVPSLEGVTPESLGRLLPNPR